MEAMEKRLDQLRSKVKSDVETHNSTAKLQKGEYILSEKMENKLGELIFHQSKSANDQLYKGLIKKYYDLNNKLNYIERMLEEFIIGGKK